MSERIRGALRNALYKSTYTRYFTLLLSKMGEILGPLRHKPGTHWEATARRANSQSQLFVNEVESKGIKIIHLSL